MAVSAETEPAAKCILFTLKYICPCRYTLCLEHFWHLTLLLNRHYIPSTTQHPYSCTQADCNSSLRRTLLDVGAAAAAEEPCEGPTSVWSVCWGWFCVPQSGLLLVRSVFPTRVDGVVDGSWVTGHSVCRGEIDCFTCIFGSSTSEETFWRYFYIWVGCLVHNICYVCCPAPPARTSRLFCIFL